MGSRARLYCAEAESRGRGVRTGTRRKELRMYRLIAAVMALMLTLSAGPEAFAAEVANAPAEQAPDIRPFTSAHFGMSGTVKVDGITVDILGEGDLAVPDKQKS